MEEPKLSIIAKYLATTAALGATKSILLAIQGKSTKEDFLKVVSEAWDERNLVDVTQSVADLVHVLKMEKKVDEDVLALIEASK